MNIDNENPHCISFRDVNQGQSVQRIRQYPVLIICNLTLRKISVQYQWNNKVCRSWLCISLCCLLNGGHVVHVVWPINLLLGYKLISLAHNKEIVSDPQCWPSVRRSAWRADLSRIPRTKGQLCRMIMGFRLHRIDTLSISLALFVEGLFVRNGSAKIKWFLRYTHGYSFEQAVGRPVKWVNWTLMCHHNELIPWMWVFPAIY